MSIKRYIQLGTTIPSEVESIDRLRAAGFHKVANALINSDYLRGDENIPIAIYEVNCFVKGEEVSTEVVEIYASWIKGSTFLGGCLGPHPLRTLAKQVAKEARDASNIWKPYVKVEIHHIGGSLPVELTQGSGTLLFGDYWTTE